MGDDPESLFYHEYFIGSGEDGNSYRFGESSKGFAVAGRSNGPRFRQSRALLNAVRSVRRLRDDQSISRMSNPSRDMDGEAEESGALRPTRDWGTSSDRIIGEEFQGGPGTPPDTKHQ